MQSDSRISGAAGQHRRTATKQRQLETKSQPVEHTLALLDFMRVTPRIA